MMRYTCRWMIVLVALVGALALAACATPTPPPPTSTPAPPTPTPIAVSDDSWTKVQQAGKLVVGTSADYPPFEFYTGEFQVDGFDIALMQAIGEKLGIQIEYNDFAFDGLGGALLLEQIDAAISALSVTPGREEVVDFSYIYTVSEDGVLAQQDSSISEITSVEQMAPYRVGVQRGSIFEKWLETRLIKTGQMRPRNLFAYAEGADAVRDLRANRLDLVVADLLPAEEAVDAGGVKLVGQGLNRQFYAIAVREGANALVDRINLALLDLFRDGTLAQLAQQYLGQEATEPVPPPAEPSTPPPPAGCIDGMQWVAELSFDDKNMTAPATLPPGQPFTKGWRVQNNGTCVWNTNYKLTYVGGNSPYARMGGEPVPVTRDVPGGDTYDFQVNLIAPLYPGTYQGFWQMVNDQGVAFGEKIWVGITVPGAPTPTPAPTQTPAPGISFTVDRTNIQQGECVTFSWDVQNVQAVYFYPQGANWKDYGVPGQGSSVECPQYTTTYELRVVERNGAVQLRQITIYVTPVASAPTIALFSVNPPQVTAGQCVFVQWDVQGDVTSVTLTRNGAPLWEGAPFSGSVQDCPTDVGTNTYGLDAVGPGGANHAQRNVTVVSPATATPAPTPVPEAPRIDAFSVSPNQIEVGQCLIVSWGASGGTTRVQLKRNGAVVVDNAPFSGSVQDCPAPAGSYTYRLEASNNAGQVVFQEQPANVTEAPPVNPLPGPTWVLTQLRGQPVIAGTTITAVFDPSGQMSGSAGCNTYGASYTANNGQMTIGLATSTAAFCGEPPGVMDQETAYLQTLASALAYQVSGNQLTITDGAQTLLVYVAQ